MNQLKEIFQIIWTRVTGWERFMANLR